MDMKLFKRGIFWQTSSGIKPKRWRCKEEAVVDERDEGDDAKDEQPEPEEHVDFLQDISVELVTRTILLSLSNICGGVPPR